MRPSLLLGHLQLPVFGICAALGLFGVLVLSQITARRARLDLDTVWDTVVALGMTALVVSRVLLVVGSFRFFVQHPLLVLSLPTVNDTGLLVTAVIGWAYLRWKRLPPLRLLDALTPCAALLWAFLSLGRWLEGTRDGMPFQSSVWPVELLAMCAAASLCAGLLHTMRRVRPPGRSCAFGMIAAGAATFALAFLRLPSDLSGAAILDPMQWLGLGMLVVGSAVVIALPAPQAEIPRAV